MIRVAYEVFRVPRVPFRVANEKLEVDHKHPLFIFHCQQKWKCFPFIIVFQFSLRDEITASTERVTDAGTAETMRMLL